jgi:hypothetical protein
MRETASKVFIGILINSAGHKLPKITEKKQKGESITALVRFSFLDSGVKTKIRDSERRRRG